MILISNQFLGKLQTIFDFEFTIKMSLAILTLNWNYYCNDFT